MFLNYRRFNEAEFRAGKFKVPFGRDQLTSVFANSFISRSLIGAQLTPGRDIGAMVHGRLAGGGELPGGWFEHDGDNVRFSEDLRRTSSRRRRSTHGRRTRRAAPWEATRWPGACSSGSTPPSGTSRRGCLACAAG